MPTTMVHPANRSARGWLGAPAAFLCLGCAAELPPPASPTPGSSAERAGSAPAERLERTAASTAAPPDANPNRHSPARSAPPDPRLVAPDPLRCPPEMALIAGRICVDRWEGTLHEVLADGSERPRSPYGTPPPGPVRSRASSAAGVVPQGYISGEQAAQACRNAGKRLCTAGEWTRACRGPGDTTFPYGADRVDRRCNDDGRATHPVVEAGRRAGLPPERMWYEGMDNPLINQLQHTLQRTGARGGCTNRYGTYDMVGNLHEWIDDPAGTFRGGYFMDTWRNGEGCNYETVAHRFSYHDYSTGFRCCMDADSVE